MYNLIIAIASGLLTFIVTAFAVGGGTFKALYGVVPGLVVLGVVYAVLARRTMGQVQEIMKGIEGQLAILQMGEQQPTPDQLNEAVDRAVETLQLAYPLDKWQFLVKAQVDGQIGQLYFMTRRYQEAIPFLKNAMKQNWVAQAMLATLYYKKQKRARVVEVFEAAAKSNAKESLLWNLYAWCLWKLDETPDAAIEVLVRAKEALPKDERTQTNLLALQNGQQMKMREWDMMWYQFHLDHPPEVREQLEQRRQARQQLQQGKQVQQIQQGKRRR